MNFLEQLKEEPNGIWRHKRLLLALLVKVRNGTVRSDRELSGTGTVRNANENVHERERSGTGTVRFGNENVQERERIRNETERVRSRTERERNGKGRNGKGRNGTGTGTVRELKNYSIYLSSADILLDSSIGISSVALTSYFRFNDGSYRHHQS